MANIKVAIHSDFFSSFSSLPDKIRKKTEEFIKKFIQDPNNPGINFEKIFNPYDNKFYSGRVNDTYRVIIAKQDTTGVYLLLWVDKHDDAYKWANTKKIEVNKVTGCLQLFDIIKITEPRKEITTYLFDRFTNEELTKLGVPQLQLEFIRSLITYEELIKHKAKFSADVYQCLEFLASGYSYEEVAELFETYEEDLDVNIDESLSTDITAQSFVVVEGENELEAMLNAPLEKWRTFLHPSQAKLVKKDFNGPVKVTGEAGTGKTVVAMHRAKYLAQNSERTILFTTFTANLVGDIQENLKILLPYDSIPNVKVINIDKLVIKFLNSNKINSQIIYDEKVLCVYWEKAILNSKEDLSFDEKFFMDEWHKIAMNLEEFTLQKYLTVPRVGRGLRLDKNTRMKVWHVFLEYVELITNDHILDIDYATYLCRDIIKKQGVSYYDSVIVDEAQDMSNNTFKFLRLLAGPEHQNDMFIVGDSHQRIYKNKAILSKCGINVKGRSTVLRINYRTTEETRKYAYGLLNDIKFDDLDNDYNNNTICKSLTHGEEPNIKSFTCFEEQSDFIYNEISNLISEGNKLNEMCIVSRSHKQIDNLAIFLNQKGILSYKINDKSTDNSSEQGVRLATMHRVKGLEFKYIFAISINDSLIPYIEHQSDDVELEESLKIESSLLYVALTRAQKKVYVLSYGTPSSFIK